MSDILLIIFLLVAIIIVIRGFFILIDKYNFVLVIIYFVLVFPIALIHSLFLGIFGSYKDKKTEIQ